MGIKYGTGDVIAQQAASGPGSEINRDRAAYFWAFGTYYGFINYTVFRALAYSPWPVGPWPKALFSAFMDGCVHVPLSFYPQFYFVREVVMCAPAAQLCPARPFLQRISDGIDWRHLCRCRSEEKRTPSEHFWVGMSKYQTNLVQDVLVSAAVFVPVGLINFRYVPLAWRTPFVSAFGLLFPIIVSWQRGAQVVEGRPPPRDGERVDSVD